MNYLMILVYKQLFAAKEMKCRYDWHQTASHVTVAVYAKKYCDTESYVELNPVRFVSCAF